MSVVLKLKHVIRIMWSLCYELDQPKSRVLDSAVCSSTRELAFPIVPKWCWQWSCWLKNYSLRSLITVIPRAQVSWREQTLKCQTCWLSNRQWAKMTEMKKPLITYWCSTSKRLKPPASLYPTPHHGTAQKVKVMWISAEGGVISLLQVLPTKISGCFMNPQVEGREKPGREGEEKLRRQSE